MSMPMRRRPEYSMSMAMYSDGPEICSGLSEVVRVETDTFRTPPRFGVDWATADEGRAAAVAMPLRTVRLVGRGNTIAALQQKILSCRAKHIAWNPDAKPSTR